VRHSRIRPRQRLIDRQARGGQEVSSDFESKTRQILHEGNAKPLVRDVPEVVDGISDSVGEVLSAKWLAIGLCYEVHQSEQGAPRRDE